MGEMHPEIEQLMKIKFQEGETNKCWKRERPLDYREGKKH